MLYNNCVAVNTRPCPKPWTQDPTAKFPTIEIFGQGRNSVFFDKWQYSDVFRFLVPLSGPFLRLAMEHQGTTPTENSCWELRSCLGYFVYTAVLLRSRTPPFFTHYSLLKEYHNNYNYFTTYRIESYTTYKIELLN